jgi:hypothetical protein
MAASGKGGSASRRRERDKARAALMKRLGIVRKTGRCPLCYKIVPNGDHVFTCRG